MLLRARLILPVSLPPIENGAIAITDNKITDVGSWNDLRSKTTEPATDLGDVVVLPGLINAHCHLDYTDMAGRLAPPRSFVDWIKAIVAFKASWSYTEFANSWINGANMLLNSGTTTVADIETVPELIPDMWNATPLRVHSFRELIQLKQGAEAQQTVDQALNEWGDLTHPHSRTGLSPHAPYSTTSDLLRATAATRTQRDWQFTTHLSESAEEFEMFMNSRGALFDWLQPQRDTNDCGLGSPVAHLERSGFLKNNLLAAHLNYLSPEDPAILARNNVHVVHCPYSHAYFNHRPFPFLELTEAGINICLGTDSLASVLNLGDVRPELNMFREMRAFSDSNPALEPESILKMATINAAQALGYNNTLGQLHPGTLADVIAIPFTGSPSAAHNAVLQNTSPVSTSVIDGQWAVGGGDQ